MKPSVNHRMKKLILISGISGLLAVALGAFGAHGLKPVLTPLQQATFETAVKYQFIHTLAMLACALAFRQFGIAAFARAAWFFAGGILLFSGSLYLISLKQLLGIHSWSFLGPVTPVGGLLFITGWICIVAGAWKMKE